MQCIPLPYRSVLAITGPERKTFLQGLITQDIYQVNSSQAAYSAFLTPQGRYLHDFFIYEKAEAIYLETDRDSLPDLQKRLQCYKLRSAASLEDCSEQFSCWVYMGADAISALQLPLQRGACRQDQDATLFVDPRTEKLGVRVIRPLTMPPLPQEASEGSWKDYNTLRLSLGIPEREDLIPEKSILLENGFNENHAISWDKGCYLGQELNARVYHQGLVRKKLVPLTIEGSAPPFNAPITYQAPGETEKAAGSMRSHQGELGLALMRLESLENWKQMGGHFYTDTAKLYPTLSAS